MRHLITKAELLSLIEIAALETLHFNPQFNGNTGDSRYLKLFSRTFSGMCGEYGYMTWMSDNGVYVKKPNRKVRFATDFITGKNKFAVEIKSFKTRILGETEPFLYNYVAKKIPVHSKIIFFSSVSLGKVFPDHSIMEKMYPGGVYFNPLGYIMSHEALQMDIKERGDSLVRIVPISKMRSIDDFLCLVKSRSQEQLERERMRNLKSIKTGGRHRFIRNIGHEKRRRKDYE